MTYYCDDKRHLVCLPFSVANLHAMADGIGLKRCWYHAGKHPHYDIPKHRYEEIAAKCMWITTRELYIIIEMGK